MEGCGIRLQEQLAEAERQEPLRLERSQDATHASHNFRMPDSESRRIGRFQGASSGSYGIGPWTGAQSSSPSSLSGECLQERGLNY